MRRPEEAGEEQGGVLVAYIHFSTLRCSLLQRAHASSVTHHVRWLIHAHHTSLSVLMQSSPTSMHVQCSHTTRTGSFMGRREDASLPEKGTHSLTEVGHEEGCDQARHDVSLALCDVLGRGNVLLLKLVRVRHKPCAPL